MDITYSTTITEKRKKGTHLRPKERDALQHLKCLGCSNRAIAKELNCNPSTIGYELQRGTPAYSGRGRKPTYSAKRGGAVYKENRSRCHCPKSALTTSPFIGWMVEQVSG